MDEEGKTVPSQRAWREQLTEADRQILVFALEQSIGDLRGRPSRARWRSMYEHVLAKLLPDYTQK